MRLLASVGLVGVLLLGFAVVAAFAVRSTGNGLLVVLVGAAALRGLRVLDERRRCQG